MFRNALLLAVLASAATPSLAQSTDAAPPASTNLPDPNDDSDTLTIGLGGAYVPDYEGSNDYRLTPAGALRGRYHGIGFATRGTSLAVNVVPRGTGKISFSAGPIAGLRLNRTGDIKDAVVKLLPERSKAIELGGFAGVSARGLTNPYDSLGLRVEVVHDVGKAHKSTIISPAIDFSTPLSRTTFVGLSAGLDFVQKRYADTYFAISPADSALTGLPVYSGKGGLKDWKVNLIALQSLSGSLLHGWAIAGTVGYAKLQGDFKRSPIVAQRGKAGQWLAAAGLAYTF